MTEVHGSLARSAPCFAPDRGAAGATGNRGGGSGPARGPARRRTLRHGGVRHDLAAAKAAGYSLQITPNMPNMGFHFLNPSIGGGVRRDEASHPRLREARRQTGSSERWSGCSPSGPTSRRSRARSYGSFPAACHYADGRFVPAAAEADCAPTNGGGAAFTFWHPAPRHAARLALVPEPRRPLRDTNPFVRPFTGD